jgi:hypothetical protein
VIRPLVLQRPEEPLHYGAVIAAAAVTHRTRYARQTQRLRIGVARTLTATIRMMQQPLAGWTMTFHRAAQRIADQFGGQRPTTRPAHDLPAEQIDRCRPIHPDCREAADRWVNPGSFDSFIRDSLQQYFFALARGPPQTDADARRRQPGRSSRG